MTASARVNRRGDHGEARTRRRRTTSRAAAWISVVLCGFWWADVSQFLVGAVNVDRNGKNMQAANFGAGFRQPGAAGVSGAGVVGAGGAGYPLGVGNRRFAAGLGGPGVVGPLAAKGPGLRRFAKGGDLQASGSSSMGTFGSTDSPALRALALLGFLFFLQQIQTLLAQGRRRKRNAPPSFQEVAGPLNLDDDGDTDANYDGLDDLDLSTWMRGATRAAVPLAVAHLVEPRAGQEGTCIQRTLCEANAELRRRADVRGVAASLLLTHGTNELISTTPEEQEANLRAASAGSSAKNCTLVSARCSEAEYNEISRVSEKLFNFASNFLVSRPA